LNIFKRKEKETDIEKIQRLTAEEPLDCDVCKKSVYLTAGLIPPGVVTDLPEAKVYTICGFCQRRLGLTAAESGFLYHEIRDGHAHVDIERIKKLIAEEEATQASQSPGRGAGGD